jgi:hypothetical protein
LFLQGDTGDPRYIAPENWSLLLLAVLHALFLRPGLPLFLLPIINP